MWKHSFFMTNFKSLKVFVIFTWLTLMPAPFQSGKNCAHGVFYTPTTSIFFYGKTSHQLPCHMRIVHWCLSNSTYFSYKNLWHKLPIDWIFSTHKSWNWRKFCAVFTFKQNIGTNCTLVTSYQGNLQAVESFYYLLGLFSGLHFSRREKHCVHVVFHTLFPWWEGLAYTFQLWKPKKVQWCSRNLLLMVSYSHPLSLPGKW